MSARLPCLLRRWRVESRRRDDDRRPTTAGYAAHLVRRSKREKDMVESTATNVVVRPTVRRGTTRDWFSAALVVLMTLVALAAGLALKSSVDGRSKSYSDPSGATLHYPSGWQLNAQDIKNNGISIRDLSAKGFPTTLGFRAVPVDPKAQDADALSVVANNLAVSRAQDLGSFKLF